MSPRAGSAFRKDVRAVKSALKRVERLLDRVSEKASQLGNRSRKADRPSQRQRKLSPKRYAALKLQGAYMGYMRQLSARQKSQVRKAKEQGGYEAAIPLARKLAGK